MQKCLVLIPAYNEGARIRAVIEGVRKTVPTCDVLIVDDGSRDDTALAARREGAEVVTHPFNMGYGAAIQTGYKYAAAAGYEYLVQIDGDGQHDPKYIPEMLESLKAGAVDFVIGSRFLGEESYNPPFARRVGMLFFRRLVSLIIRTPVTDCTSGYQAFNRSVIEFFTRDLFPVDYPDADVLITLHRAGFAISEIPVRMFSAENGKSMHSGLKPVYYMFKMLLSILVTLLRKVERNG